MKRTVIKRIMTMLLTFVLTAGEISMGTANVYAADESHIIINEMQDDQSSSSDMLMPAAAEKESLIAETDKKPLAPGSKSDDDIIADDDDKDSSIEEVSEESLTEDVIEPDKAGYEVEDTVISYTVKAKGFRVAPNNDGVRLAEEKHEFVGKKGVSLEDVVLTTSGKLHSDAECHNYITIMPLPGTDYYINWTVYNDKDKYDIDYSELKPDDCHMEIHGYETTCTEVKLDAYGQAKVCFKVRRLPYVEDTLISFTEKVDGFQKRNAEGTDVISCGNITKKFIGKNGVYFNDVVYTMQGFLYSDAKCSNPIPQMPASGNVYYTYVLLYDDSDTWNIDFSQLKPDDCHMEIDGYEATCTEVKLDAYGQAYVYFKVSKIPYEVEDTVTSLSIYADGVDVGKDDYIFIDSRSRSVVGETGTYLTSFITVSESVLFSDAEFQNKTIGEPAYGNDYFVAAHLYTENPNYSIDYSKLKPDGCHLELQGYETECFDVKLSAIGTAYAYFKLRRLYPDDPELELTSIRLMNNRYDVWENWVYWRDGQTNLTWKKTSSSVKDEIKEITQNFFYIDNGVFYTDPECEQFATSRPHKNDVLYVSVSLFNRLEDHRVDLTKLTKENCLLFIDGFTVECIGIDYSQNYRFWDDCEIRFKATCTGKTGSDSYHLLGFTRTAAEIERHDVYRFISNNDMRLDWDFMGQATMDNVTFSASFICTDEGLTSPIKGDPEPGKYYYLDVSVYNTRPRDHRLDFSTLNPAYCTLNLKGYETECIGVQTCVTGNNQDRVDATFKIWKPVLCTVTFEAEGGSGYMAPIKVMQGDYITLPACGFGAPTGKKFKWWNYGNPGDKFQVNMSLPFRAVWENVYCWVTYKSGEGGETGLIDRPVYGSSYLIKAGNIFTPPEGKQFDRWKVEGKDKYLNVSDTVTIRENLVLTATYKDKPVKCTVTLKSGEGTGEDIVREEEKNKPVLFIGPPSAFKPPEGKEFDYWEVEGTGEAVRPYSEIVITKDTVLIARWRNPLPSHRIEFDNGGGSGLYAHWQVKEGASIRLPENPFGPPGQYQDFSYWKVNDSTTEYYPGDEVKVNGEMTVTAMWTDIRSHTVSFNVNGHGNTPDSISLKVGSSLTEIELPTPSASGFVFAGWYEEDSCLHEFKPGDEDKMPDNDLTLYAKWLITVSRLEISGLRNPVVGEWGIGLSALNVPEGARYDVTGLTWYDGETNTAPGLQPPSFGGKTETEGKPYYAEIELYVDNGYGLDPSLAKDSVYINGEASKIEEIKEKDLYHCRIKTKPMISEWKGTVTFNTMGGSEISSVTVKKGTSVSRPDDPFKSGYIFGGWYEEEECNNRYDFSKPVPDYKTLYAKWDEDPSFKSTLKDICVYATGTDNTAVGVYLADTEEYLFWDGGKPAASAYMAGDVGVYSDEKCEEQLTSYPEDGGIYYDKYTVYNRISSNPLNFKQVVKEDCSLIMPGYQTRCISVKTYKEAGVEGLEIIFKMVKGVYAVEAIPDEVSFEAELKADGTYDAPAYKTVKLENTGENNVIFDYAANTELTGDDAEIFEIVKTLDTDPATIIAGYAKEICNVRVKPGLTLMPNHIYRAELTLSTDHANVGAVTKVPLTFSLTGAKPTGIWMEEIPYQDYTGSKITPEVRVYWGEKLLSKDDYTVSYKNNTNAYTLTDGQEGFAAGKAPTVTVRGKGNFKGSFSRNFVIRQVDLLTGATAPNVQLQYTGKELKPTTDVTVVLGGRTVKLKAGKDFVYEYPHKGIKDPGVYQITIAPKSGNYVRYQSFKAEVLDKKPVSKLKMSKIADVKWDGSPKKPDIIIKDGNYTLVKDVDYAVSYENNNNAGTAKVTVKGIGSYFGTLDKTFRIVGTQISKAKVLTYEGFKESIPYDNAAVIQTPGSFALSVDRGATVLPALAYDITYENNTLPGTAKMIFTGREENGYTGTLTRTFKITGYDIAGDPADKMSVLYMNGGVEALWPEGATPEFGYTAAGAGCEPIVRFGTGELVKGQDYTVSWKDNTAVKTVLTGSKDPVMTIKGKGNYKGTITRTFKVGPGNFAASVAVIASDVNWQDKAGIYKPTITVIEKDTGMILKAGKDYCAVNDAEYPVKFIYEELPMGEKVMNDNGKSNPRSEVAVTAGVTEVLPTHVIPAGTVIGVVVTGKGAYAGTTASANYRFVKKPVSIADRSFKISISEQQWTGEPVMIRPEDVTVTSKVSRTETVTLIPGTDYEVMAGSYVNNVKRGTAKVTIRGKGSYGGTKEVKFKIVQRRFNYMISYDRDTERLRKLIYDKHLTDEQKTSWTAEQKEEWFNTNFRITGSMKKSATSYMGQLAANKFKVLQYNSTTNKWVNMPDSDVAFKGWAIKSGGNKIFSDKALFRPSWLMRLTYDDSVTLYAVWE